MGNDSHLLRSGTPDLPISQNGSIPIFPFSHNDYFDSKKWENGYWPILGKWVFRSAPLYF
jgi:hypothetical protein